MEKGYLMIFCAVMMFTNVICYNQYGSICPFETGTIITDHIQISVNGDIALTNFQRYCYNYSLVKHFQSRPNVAIGLSKLEALPSTSLYISIKSYHQDNSQKGFFHGKYGLSSTCNNIIPFAINLLSKYTSWNLIQFYFIAENKINMQAGYYLADLDILADCSQIGKSTSLFLPFKNQFNTSDTLKAYTFLHGFLINSQILNGGNSPLQLQIINKKANSTGLIVTLSVTSNTQVYQALISYFVYCSNSNIIQAQQYIYESLTGISNQNYVIYSAQIQTSQIQGLIQGISGFILNSNSKPIQFVSDFHLNTSIFNFSLNQNWKYVAYDFVILLGGICADCAGHTIFFNGSCIDSCPYSTFFNGYTCIQCAIFQIWNGTDCINRCNGGQVYNQTSGICSCSINTQWNGYSCIPCYGGKYWNSSSKTCQCSIGQNWNGNMCIYCDFGKIFDSLSKQCVCPPGYIWGLSSCILNCMNGQVWNSSINQCQCPSPYIWNGYSCSQCTGGMIFNSYTNQCQCFNSVWNGYSCSTICQNGQIWNSNTFTCQCPQYTYPYSGGCLACGSTPYDQNMTQCKCNPPTYFNGYKCVTCSGGQQWNSYLCSCSCSTNQNWNGSQCVSSCNNGYQAIANNCFCPSTMYEFNGKCILYPNCTNGTMWNGNTCQSIQCNPGSFWNGTICSSSSVSCPMQTYWNGFYCCNVATTCPNGTQWTGQYCMTIQNNCPNGTYFNNNACLPIPSQCPSGLVWNSSQIRCIATSSTCPTGTYFNGYSCLPYSNCTNGKIWSNSQVQCVCSQNTFWNGNTCISCGNGQIYGLSGCFCPNGTYFNGSSCIYINSAVCNVTQFSVLNNGVCVCLPGFDNINGKCTCLGLIVSKYCNKCFSKPNSFWNNYTCQCQSGYIQYLGQCLSISNSNNSSNSNTSSICSVGNYFQTSQKKCILCSDGCLSCSSCYNCLQCRPQYYYYLPTTSCIEICGDGLRFSLQCDDGNNNDGDGCSRDCKVQNSYSCSGGSPNSKDVCTLYKPSSIDMKVTGQSHLFGKIIINVKLNYLPNDFVNGQDCITTCDKILEAKIISGFSSSTSIISSYIKSTSYSFSIQINFGRQPIGIFIVEVSINQSLKQKFFQGIDISGSIRTQVNPAYLALADKNNQQVSTLK